MFEMVAFQGAWVSVGVCLICLCIKVCVIHVKRNKACLYISKVIQVNIKQLSFQKILKLNGIFINLKLKRPAFFFYFWSNFEYFSTFLGGLRASPDVCELIGS